MRTIKIRENQICRAFPTFADACHYVLKFVPPCSHPEVVKVWKEGKGSAYSFIFYKSLGDKERTLFELKEN